LARKLPFRKENNVSFRDDDFVSSGETVFVSKIENGRALLSFPYEGWIDLRDSRGYLQLLPIQSGV